MFSAFPKSKMLVWNTSRVWNRGRSGNGTRRMLEMMVPVKKSMAPGLFLTRVGYEGLRCSATIGKLL